MAGHPSPVFGAYAEKPTPKPVDGGSSNPFEKLGKLGREARSQSVLKAIRAESAFTDAVILAEGREFAVHRNVMSTASPFFKTAFTGVFSEAQKGRMRIGDASAAALSIVIDFAYCANVADKIKGNAELAAEVLRLAHRFDIPLLKDTAAMAAVQLVAPPGAVKLYHQLKLYACRVQEARCFKYIASNLPAVSRACPEFPQLEAEELQRLLASTSLVATVLEVFEAVRAWAAGRGGGGGERALLGLFRHVRLELLSWAELQGVLSDAACVPREALLRALEGAASGRAAAPPVRVWPRPQRDFRGVTVALGVPPPTSAFPSKPTAPHAFRLGNWVLSAHLEMSRAKVVCVRFAHRERPDRSEANWSCGIRGTVQLVCGRDVLLQESNFAKQNFYPNGVTRAFVFSVKGKDELAEMSAGELTVLLSVAFNNEPDASTWLPARKEQAGYSFK